MQFRTTHLNTNKLTINHLFEHFLNSIIILYISLNIFFLASSECSCIFLQISIPLVHRIFQMIFYRNQLFFDAEIDVLISVSIASNYYEGPTCRPTITEASWSDTNTPYLSAKSLGHPLLQSDTLGKGSFVHNDVNIGGGHSSFILLTGPNMGGKSTLLRQICLAVILAQVH